MPVVATWVVPLAAGKPTASNSPPGAVSPITAIPRGKKKKSALNQRRGKLTAHGPKMAAPGASVPKNGSAQWNEAMVEHVRMVSSWIEGRWVSRKEILDAAGESFETTHHMPPPENRSGSGLVKGTSALTADTMANEVELAHLDLRYESFRLKQAAAGGAAFSLDCPAWH